MIRRYIATLVLLALSACPTQPTAPRVIVLLHGLYGGPEQFRQAPYDLLLAGLTERGWRVVTPEHPEDDAPNPVGELGRLLSEHPDQYRADSIDIVRDIIADSGGHVVIGGVSWGGWHTLAAAHLEGVDAWFAHLPVTRVSALTEFSQIDTSAADVTSLADVTSPGLIRWGTRDDRVIGSLAADVAATAPGRVTVQAVDQDHTSTAADVVAILRWLDTCAVTS